MTKVRMKKILWIFLGLLVIPLAGFFFAYSQGRFTWLPMIAWGASEDSSSDPAIALIPGPDDWVDYGPILEAGGEGEWDFLWADETPGSIVKKDSTYYFYLIGADGWTSIEGEPRHRSIGVATSQDGIHYTKFPGNPILTHSPLNGEEEGANSAGVTLDAEGNFVLYYGAATGARETIRADGRLAVSSDGFNFTDMGLVLNHRNPLLYGFGDEIFPTATFYHNGRWNVYYLPNGGTNQRTLGLARGRSPERLNRSTGVLDERSGGKPVGTWGNIIWLSPDRIALFIQRLWWPDTFIEVRTASPDAPHRLSEPVARYDIPDLKRGAVFLDAERRTWFMIYNDFDRFWDLKLAPAGEPDTTPPTIPADLQASALSHTEIELTWQAASDSETGVVSYNVYRDGELLGSTNDWAFIDTGLVELSEYPYEVSAVNFHGFEGPRASVRATTLGDAAPPELVSATTQGSPNRLAVTFSEPVDQASAENIANYAISPEIGIVSASLDAELRTVNLTTADHTPNSVYTISVKDILDRAVEPNAVPPESQVLYTHSPEAGLAGLWTLDQGSGGLANDTSGFGNHGTIVGATWQEGIRNGALQFDGIDDYVLVEDTFPLDRLSENSFTFAAWVNPEDLPGKKNPYGIILRANGHPGYYFGLMYTKEGKYRAQILNENEDLITLDSSQLNPGAWRHVAMVVDTETLLLHLYVDGAEASGSPLPYTGNLMGLYLDPSVNHISSEYYIGSNKPDRGAGSFFTQHFKGMIDEVRIYNQALSAESIYCLAKNCP